ncbi:hypothetical protein FO519_009801, partial [Halicephalobus sp. NKZ332]
MSAYCRIIDDIIKKNMAEYVGYAKKISEYFLSAGDEAKGRIKKKFKNRNIEDVRVLHTMLERCSQSPNSQLKKDLQEYDIPGRLKKVAELVTSKHEHSWSSSYEKYTFFQCIKEMNNWYSYWGAIDDFVGNFPGNPYGAGLDDDNAMMDPQEYYKATSRRMGFPRYTHAKEVDEKLTWVVEEIETLYNQTNSLMLANLSSNSAE